jgi:hypothetical protein
MMRDLSVLKPEFRAKAEAAIAAFKLQTGFGFLVTDTRRDPWTQARLFRQSRSFSQIKDRAERLIARGFPELADILISVGPQGPGPSVTNAGPGEGWHQYDEALDGCPKDPATGFLIWDKRFTGDPAPIWQAWGECAEAEGLNWGGNWTHPDRPHIQLRGGSYPLDVYSRDEVLEMIERTRI